MKDKWLVMDGGGCRHYILYDDISAFRKNASRRSIEIFIRGNYNPFIFNFSTAADMDEALEEITKQLAVEPNK